MTKEEEEVSPWSKGNKRAWGEEHSCPRTAKEKWIQIQW